MSPFAIANLIVAAAIIGCLAGYLIGFSRGADFYEREYKKAKAAGGAATLTLIVLTATIFGHPVPAQAGEQWAGSDANLLAGIAEVESPRGLRGAAGETTVYQLLPATRAACEARLRAKGITHPTERQLGVEHLAQIRRELRALGVDLLPFNLALAWNAGSTAAATGRAPVSSYDYALRVLACAESLRR